MEHSKQEERKGFYKNLFRFNALLDIAIDEEEFVLGDDNNNQKIKGKWNKAFQKQLKVWRYEDFEKITKTSVQEEPDFDLQLQTIWEEFLKELGNDVAPQVKLRKKGIELLLLAKYTRALHLADPLQEDLSTKQDTLTRFVSANLSHLYPSNEALTEESTYLQTLLLLECAACASGEATIGFLNLAESAVPSKKTGTGKDQGGKFYAEFKNVVPYFSALVEYNKAVAFTHVDRREKALESVGKSIAFVRGALEKNKMMAEDKVTLSLYLEIPARYLRADLFNKMQCCTNAVQTLEELYASLKSLNVSEHAISYKYVRGLLLESLCWHDMGDQDMAFSKVREALDFCDHNGDLIPQKIKSEFIKRSCSDEDNDILGDDDYKKVLREKATLSTDAFKLVLQLDLETWKSSLPKKTPPKENLVKRANIFISKLENFISAYHPDRFQRQNLKALAVDWLKVFSRIERVQIQNDNSSRNKSESDSNEKHSIRSSPWRVGVGKILNCLGDEEKQDGQLQVEMEGDISNEIWGDHFKKFYSNSLLDILAHLTDYCEMFFHDEGAHKPKKDDRCKYPEERKFLRDLVKFERKVLGLDDDYTFTDEDEGSVYPKEGTYEYRSAKRRGSVLKKYFECAEGNEDKKCGEKCFNPVKESFTWLDEEGGGVEACLRKLNESWPHEIENKENLEIGKQPTLWLKDYRQIIGDSDFRQHLQSGRSEQPINLFHNKNKAKPTGVEFVALRRWNSHTPEISFSKGGGYFVFIPKDPNPGDRDNDRQGGVFRATRLGIVVDPGFDLIHNFFSQGFTLDDIDLVLITHADADHINDYAGLADLFRVRSKPGKSSKKIYTFIPRNAHGILKRYITDESYRPLYYDTVLIDVNEELSANEFSLKLPVGNGSSPPRMIIENDEAECDDPWLIIRCVPASHDDHTEERPGSFGYVLTFKEHKEKIGTIGFTGDSQWFPKFANNFEDCDLICSHMGNVLGEKMNDYGKIQHLGDWEALIRKKNHPYLPGEILFLQQLRKQKNSPKQRIVVLSEFGEELKGLIRKDVCERLNRCMVNNTGDGCWSNFVIQEDKKKNTEVTAAAEKGKEEEGKKAEDYCKACKKDKDESKHIRTIPADIGLRVSIQDGEAPVVHCVLCDRFHDPEDMEWIPHGSEEAMFYVCGPCCRSKSRDIRVAKYESILGSGRPVRRAHVIPKAGKSGDNN